mgnify:CR=1 FL=1
MFILYSKDTKCNNTRLFLWGIMKRLEKPALHAVKMICAVAACALIFSCATTGKVQEEQFAEQPSKEAEVPAVKEKPAVSKKKTFTKMDFLESLSSCLEKNDFDAALALYDTLPQEFASDYDLLFLKASVYFSAGRIPESKALCDELSAIDPSNTDVMELSAIIAKKTGNSAERSRKIAAIIAKDKFNPGANVELAGDAFMKRNYKLAKTYYNRALARDSDNEDALFGLGQTEYYLENDDSAKKSLEKLLEKNPDYAPAYLYLGKIAAANNEYKIASDYAKTAIEKDPTQYDYFMDYGMYERYLGHYDAAEEAWTQAIQIESGYFLAYAYRAGLYDERNMFPQALADYKKVVELNPEYYFAHESLGVLALHEKQWSTARASFEECYKKNPANVSYPLMVTYCYYMEGNDIEARNFSNQALRVMDRNTIEYTMLRVYHDKAGEMPLPQRIAALKNRNLRGKMYFYLGLFYDMFGGKEAAKEYYTKVVEMNSPMFFEYRLAEWSIKENGTE